MNETEPPNTDPEASSADRWEFLRDVLVFQMKLALDAMRDVILVPISIGAAVLDVVASDDKPGKNFYRIFAIGKQTDIWINLFDTYGDPDETADGGDTTVDTLVGQLEGLLIEHYDRGGLTATAKEAVDRALDGISKPPQR